MLPLQILIIVIIHNYSYSLPQVLYEYIYPHLSLDNHLTGYHFIPLSQVEKNLRLRK